MEYSVLSVEAEQQRIKEFKSFYYELNAKPDTITKIFNDKVVVLKDDISRLNEMVREKLALHSIDGEFGISSVSVATGKNKVITFDNFKLFEINNWDIPEHIERITVTWDFFINVENYKKPQRHKLTVKISSGLKVEEIMGLLFSGRIEDIQEIEEQQATIIAQMDFIESRLGQEFINIVAEWVNTLERAYTQKNKIVLWLKKNRRIVSVYFNYVFFFMLCITCLVGFNYFLGQMDIDSMGSMSRDNFASIVNYCVICVIICIFVLNRGEYLANKLYRLLSEYGETFVFRITKGDERKYKSTIDKDKNGAIKILGKCGLSLIENIVCGIITTFLLQLLQERRKAYVKKNN